jgi:hypothetical protein
MRMIELLVMLAQQILAVVALVHESPRGPCCPLNRALCFDISNPDSQR